MIAINKTLAEPKVWWTYHADENQFVLVIVTPDGEETVMVRNGNPFEEALEVIAKWRERHGIQA